MPLNMLALFFLGTVAAGGLVWVFLYPIMSGERHVERRQALVARPEAGAARAATGRGAPKPRRDQVEDSLKQLEVRQRNAKRPPLALRISRAGLSLSNRQFILISAALGLGAFALGFAMSIGLLPAFALGFAGVLGLPRWLLIFLKKRREARFLANFPDAVDVIVRGLKAGLPLGDCMKMIASDAREPVKSEFRAIIETQAIGMPISEACAKLYVSMPVPEANFFAIVISIQQKVGGNLSEALGNLSKVLRDRKKMQAKIRAMSMEAKASAAIIGALPPGVMTLVWLTSPQYIELLWITPIGRMMLAACLFWMFLGVMVMKKMINFDF
jgi:tight adherence protein B